MVRACSPPPPPTVYAAHPTAASSMPPPSPCERQRHSPTTRARARAPGPGVGGRRRPHHARRALFSMFTTALLPISRRLSPTMTRLRGPSHIGRRMLAATSPPCPHSACGHRTRRAMDMHLCRLHHTRGLLQRLAETFVRFLGGGRAVRKCSLRPRRPARNECAPSVAVRKEHLCDPAPPCAQAHRAGWVSKQGCLRLLLCLFRAGARTRNVQDNDVAGLTRSKLISFHSPSGVPVTISSCPQEASTKRCDILSICSLPRSSAPAVRARATGGLGLDEQLSHQIGRAGTDEDVGFWPLVPRLDGLRGRAAPISSPRRCCIELRASGFQSMGEKHWIRADFTAVK